MTDDGHWVPITKPVPVVDRHGYKYDEFQAVYHSGSIEECNRCKEMSINREES